MIVDWQLVANVATGLGFFLAAASLLWQVSDGISSRAIARSESCLQDARESLDEVLQTLAHYGNEREGWIAAARAVNLAEKIAEDIVVDNHKAVFEVARLRFRRKLGDELGFDNPARTAAFFYGADDTTLDVDEAARQSTARQGGRASLKELPEAAIYRLWKAAQFPEHYDDPLPEEQFPDEIVEKGTTSVLWPGLTKYLKHRRRWRSTAGQLRERCPPPPMTPEKKSVEPTLDHFPPAIPLRSVAVKCDSRLVLDVDEAEKMNNNRNVPLIMEVAALGLAVWFLPPVMRGVMIQTRH